MNEENWGPGQTGDFNSKTCNYTGPPPFDIWPEDPDWCEWCASTGHPFGDEAYGICKCPGVLKRREENSHKSKETLRQEIIKSLQELQGRLYWMNTRDNDNLREAVKLGILITRLKESLPS